MAPPAIHRRGQSSSPAAAPETARDEIAMPPRPRHRASPPIRSGPSRTTGRGRGPRRRPSPSALATPPTKRRARNRLNEATKPIAPVVRRAQRQGAEQPRAPGAGYAPPGGGERADQVAEEVRRRDEAGFGLADPEARCHVRQDRRIDEAPDPESGGKRQEAAESGHGGVAAERSHDRRCLRSRPAGRYPPGASGPGRGLRRRVSPPHGPGLLGRDPGTTPRGVHVRGHRTDQPAGPHAAERCRRCGADLP